MGRNHGTNRNGGAFSLQEKSAAWYKAKAVEGYDSQKYRQDVCGAWIAWEAHGNTQHEHGWEVDHITPVAAGGSDHPDNLQALHWKNNRAKSDNTGEWLCAIT